MGRIEAIHNPSDATSALALTAHQQVRTTSHCSPLRRVVRAFRGNVQDVGVGYCEHSELNETDSQSSSI